MTVDEARAEIADHYVPCCALSAPLLAAARALLVEVDRLTHVAETLREQRDDARARSQQTKEQ